MSDTKLKIQYVTTSIYESDAECLVNTVNLVGVMGKGIALGFKKQYPDMFVFYRKMCAENVLKIGQPVLWKSEDEKKRILLFPTKIHWRYPSKLDYVEQGLQTFAKKYEKYDIKSIAFPRLGCGNGGLDFDNHVRPIMEKYLSDINLDVRIHI